MYLLNISPEYVEGFLPYIPESLRKELFYNEARAIGCVYDGLACGAVVLSKNEEKPFCRIRSIYVDPKVRRRGVGRLLMSGAAQTGHKLGASGLVIRYALDAGEQEAFEGFLKGFGFCEFANSASIYRSSLGELVKSPFRARYGRFADRTLEIVSFDRLQPEVLEEFHLRHEPEIPPYLRISATLGMVPEISFAALRNGNIIGYLLVSEHRSPDGIEAIEFSSAYVADHSNGLTGAFPSLVEKCVNAVVQKYSGETQVVVQALNRTVNGIVRQYITGISYRMLQEREAWFRF